MRVQLKIPRVDVRRSYAIGDVIEVSPEEAKRLIDSGKAAPVREERETATLSTGETRKKKRAAKRHAQ